ncbi:MAG: hypothetical protein K8S97_06490 [Anaerolineae bacterium]|nr:hypothetical protein [Anaerolineae bacterium]
MPFTVQTLLDEPIIICTYHEPFGAQDLPQIFRQVSQFAAAMTPPIYRIIDNRGLDFSFSQMTLLMAEETRGTSGSISDIRIVAVIVTDNQLAQFGIDSMQEQEQYGQQQLSVFPTVDEALAYVRAEIAQHG